MVRRRTVRAEELLDLYLGRIDARNDLLQAVVQRFPRTSRRRARAIDRAVQRGDARGSLLGVPFGIKDTDPMRMAWNRVGSRAYKMLWTPMDAPQVTRMRRAGVVLACRTSTSELGLMPVVHTDLHPPTRNPWNPDCYSGGSSGGASSAVASGMLPVAHAADGAGSIRIPAALCHLYGFKASRGLTPHFYAALDECGLTVIGSVSRTVGDSAAVMDALCGRPTAEGPQSLLAASQRPPPEGLRIGMCLNSPMAEVDPLIAEAVQGVAGILEDLGHHVEPLASPDGGLEDFLPVYSRLATRPPVLSESHLQPVSRWLRSEGRGVTAAQAKEVARALSDRVMGWFGDLDLLLTPTTPVFAPRVGVWDDLPAKEAFHAAAVLGAFTAPFNASGQPAASVPAGVGGPDNLPIGAQIIGAPGADELVFQVSRQLEMALDWRRRRAPGWEA